MSERHLGKGSTNPPFTKGKLRLYSMRFCPYAERIHLVLDAKHIPHDVVNINLMQKPDWFLERNPLGKVPAIETEDGRCLYESLIVADYLDEQFPDSPLHSGDPAQKAQDRICLELFSKVTQLVFRTIMDADNREQHFSDLQTELDRFEKELSSRGTPFFAGSGGPGMLDYMLWPWFERVAALGVLADQKLSLPNKEKHAKLVQWQALMEKDAAVKKWSLPPETHGRFLSGYKTGTVDYDILVR
ncbi:pyrimidodiazepine synthase-like [Periplaneta americana]|uniref:pyrimidodiazepine synthase-like n=1 Tax=Periplaneta americana TaxID=6978 RepID=UPI0037E8E4E4